MVKFHHAGETPRPVQQGHRRAPSPSWVASLPARSSVSSRLLRNALGRAGLSEIEDADTADLVINVVDADDAKPFRRRRAARSSSACTSATSHSLPEDYPMLVRALANIALCYVPGKGAWFTTMERGHYGDIAEEGRGGTRRRGRPAAAAARALTARDRQRVRHRPRAGSLGRRRGDGGDHAAGRAARRPRPAALAVPDRGPAQRARAAPRQAALRDRRPLLRQPLPAEGRAAVLDERQRRRQVEARDAGPRHPARLELRPGARPDRAQRPAGGRAAPRLGRRDRALDDLPGPPGVGAILHVHAWMEDIPATDVNYPCGTEELAVNVAQLLAAEPEPERGRDRPPEPRHHRHRAPG